MICEDCKTENEWEISLWCGKLEMSCLGCGLCYNMDGSVQIDKGGGLR